MTSRNQGLFFQRQGGGGGGAEKRDPGDEVDYKMGHFNLVRQKGLEQTRSGYCSNKPKSYFSIHDVFVVLAKASLRSPGNSDI